MSDPLGLFSTQSNEADPLGLFDAPKKQNSWFENDLAKMNAAEQDVAKKTEEYQQTPGKFLQDFMGKSVDNNTNLLKPLVGIAEQIPAGLQAVGGVASGLANAGLGLFSDKYSYQSGKEGFANTTLSKALTPETESGKALYAGIGALLSKFDKSLDNPEMIKTIVNNTPGLNYMHDWSSPEGQRAIEAAVYGFGKAAPDIAVAAGAEHAIAPVVGAVKAFKNRPTGKLEVLDQQTTPTTKAPEVWQQQELPLENSVQQVAEMQNRPTGQRDLFAPVNEPQPVTLGQVSPREIPKPLEHQSDLPFNTSVEEIARRQSEGRPQADMFAENRLPERPVEQPKQLTDFGTRERTGYTQGQELQLETPRRETPIVAERPTMERAVDKVAAGQNFALSAEERIIWEKTKAAVEQVTDHTEPLSEKQIAQKMMDRTWVEEAVTKARQMDQMYAEIMKRTTDRISMMKAEKAREQLGETLDTLEQHLKETGKKVEEFTGFGPKTYKAKQLENAPKIKVPRGQRGALNFGSSEPGKNKFFASIPGFEHLKSLIPKDAAPAAVLPKILSEKDGNIRFNRVQSGAMSMAEKTGSTLIQTVGRYVQNAYKRAELAHREFVIPVEKAFTKLPRKDVKDLAGVMKREMFDGRVITDEQLANAKFTPDQIAAYKGMRNMFKEALKAQNESRVSLGLKPLTEKEAYLSSRWSGEWKAPVYIEGADGKPKLAWYVAERTKIGAENAIKYLKDNGYKVVDDMSQVKYRGSGSVGKASYGQLPDAYVTMLDILGKDDLVTQTIKELMEAQMSTEGFQSLGQSKHFKHKENVRGFQGDRPWANETKDAYNLFKEQFDYAKNAFEWAELQKATSASKELLTNGDVLKNQPKNVTSSKMYLKNALGLDENRFVKGLESQIAETLGIDKSFFYKPINNMKSYFLTSKLALSLGYTAANLLQPIWSGARHRDLSHNGFKHNPLKTTSMALSDGTAALLRHEVGVNAPMSKLGERALDYYEANGGVSRNIYDEASSLGKNKVLEHIEAPLAYTVAAPEKLARSVSFMSFVHHLEQSGKFKGNELGMFQKAEELTNMTMVDYRRTERPSAFQQVGAVGNALATLQTFKFNYLNTLHEFSQKAAKGNWTPLATWIATQGIIGGAISLPFLQDADDIWETIKGALPHGAYTKVKDVSIKPYMISHMGDLAYGLPSNILGVDLSSRMDASQTQDLSMSGLFPFIADTYRQASSLGEAVTNSNETTMSQAAYNVAPTGLQGMVETSLPAFKAGPKNAQGKQVYQRPRALEKHEGLYARTPKEELIRSIGLRSLEESKTSTMEYRMSQNNKELSDRMKQAATDYYDAISRKASKEVIAKYANRYIELGGQSGALQSLIKQGELNQSTTPDQRRAIAAKTQQGATTYNRYDNFNNP